MAAKSLLSLLVAIIAISSVLAQTPMDWQPLLEQQNLVLRQVVQTLHLTRGGPVGPEETDACFDWYLNNQTAINEAYYKEYNGCRDRATAAKKLLSTQSALERQDLLNDGHALCSELSACESVVDGLKFFQCYSKASSDNSANLLNITVTSERIADKLTISYQAINDTERVCTTEARVKNVNELAASRTYLNECLNGDWSPPNGVPVAPEEAPIASTVSAAESTQSAESQRLFAQDTFRFAPMARLNEWNTLKRV